jgi:hypothetical protein
VSWLKSTPTAREWVHGDEFDTLIIDVSGNVAFYYFSLSF